MVWSALQSAIVAVEGLAPPLKRFVGGAEVAQVGGGRGANAEQGVIVGDRMLEAAEAMQAPGAALQGFGAAGFERDGAIIVRQGGGVVALVHEDQAGEIACKGVSPRRLGMGGQPGQRAIGVIGAHACQRLLKNVLYAGLWRVATPGPFNRGAFHPSSRLCFARIKDAKLP